MIQTKQAGYTLVELMVAIVVIGILVIGVSSFMIGITNIQKNVNYKESASRAASTEMESLRNAKYNTLVNGSTIDFTDKLPDNLPSNRSGTVEVSEPTTGLKKVVVTVSYQTNGQTQQVKLSSLIGQIGISK